VAGCSLPGWPVCSRFVSGDPLVDGHQCVVVDRTGRECFSVAEGAVVSYQLLGQRPQFGVGGLGAPPQHLEGGVLVYSVDQDEPPALCVLRGQQSSASAGYCTAPHTAPIHSVLQHDGNRG